MLFGPIENHEIKLIILLSTIGVYKQYSRILWFAFCVGISQDYIHKTLAKPAIVYATATIAFMSLLSYDHTMYWIYAAVALCVVALGSLGRAVAVPVLVMMRASTMIYNDMDPSNDLFAALEVVFVLILCMTYGTILGSNLPAQAGHSLRQAVRNSDADKVLSLLRCGINPNCADDYGMTALHICAQQSMVEIAAYLLKHGANPNQQDAAGFTALHWAVQMRSEESSEENRLELIRILLEYGADKSNADMNGITPLMIASRKGNSSALALFEEQ